MRLWAISDGYSSLYFGCSLSVNIVEVNEDLRLRISCCGNSGILVLYIVSILLVFFCNYLV